MKHVLFMIAMVLLGCGEMEATEVWVSNPSDPNNVKIEKAIRKSLKKPEGKLTKEDLEKVTQLNLYKRQLTDVKGLE